MLRLVKVAPARTMIGGRSADALHYAGRYALVDGSGATVGYVTGSPKRAWSSADWTVHTRDLRPLRSHFRSRREALAWASCHLTELAAPAIVPSPDTGVNQ